MGVAAEQIHHRRQAHPSTDVTKEYCHGHCVGLYCDGIPQTPFPSACMEPPPSSLLLPLAACCRSPNRACQVKGCCQSPLLPSTNSAGRHSRSATLSFTPCGPIRFSPGPPPPGHPCSCSSRTCSCQALVCAGHNRAPAGRPLRVQGLIPAGWAVAREAVQCLMDGSLSCCRWAAG